ncbi:MAG: galactose mutarotase [Bacteroides sp.]|nr:galactose mutarotase [Bacillota bacterium]MCM1393800.1 galactose mutarotase [[Eubacterium] siraeum]MCM1455119.1 galactose mutarotase [Bacteroides sp.]
MTTKFLNVSATGIETYLLENEGGMRAQIITFGARIQKLFVPDREGRFIDVVAGFDNPEEYRDDRGTYFGAIIGRVANRIGGAEFSLGGKTYTLFKNDGNNHLHGGKEGFDKKLWNAEILSDGSLKLSYFSKDGEEGYPANLKISVIYTLSDDNALGIEYEAESDGDTVCSFTNHAYFNLDGKFESALNHEIFISADAITSVDKELIPDGEIVKVQNTPFDFNTPKTLGRDIKVDDELLINARGGYDINYILNNDGERAVATAYSKDSGIKMSVYTDRPCMQFYSGNFLDGFKGKTDYPYQSAFCMETQGYPNACNVPSFDGITLKAGKKYRSFTKYRFELG